MSGKKSQNCAYFSYRSRSSKCVLVVRWSNKSLVLMLDAEGAGRGCCLPEGSLSLMSEEREEEGPSQQATS